jgi:hypothetical protein
MLGVSPVNPQMVWWNGIKTLATSKCSACKPSSGMAGQHQNPSHARCFACKPSSGVAGTASKPWPRPGVLPVNPQVVWQDDIKTLAMLGVSPVNPQVVWRNGIKTLATSRCSAYKLSSGIVGRRLSPSHSRHSESSAYEPFTLWQSDINP